MTTASNRKAGLTVALTWLLSGIVLVSSLISLAISLFAVSATLLR